MQLQHHCAGFNSVDRLLFRAMTLSRLLFSFRFLKLAVSPACRRVSCDHGFPSGSVSIRSANRFSQRLSFVRVSILCSDVERFSFSAFPSGFWLLVIALLESFPRAFQSRHLNQLLKLIRHLFIQIGPGGTRTRIQFRRQN